MSPPVRPGSPRTSGVRWERTHEARSPSPRPPLRRRCRLSLTGLPAIATSRAPAGATCARPSSASRSLGTNHRRQSRWTSPRSAGPSTPWYRPGPRSRASGGRICAAAWPPPSRPQACGRCSKPTTSTSTRSGPAFLRLPPAGPTWPLSLRPVGEPATDPPRSRRREHD